MSFVAATRSVWRRLGVGMAATRHDAPRRGTRLCSIPRLRKAFLVSVESVEQSFDTVLVVDFGAQYAQLIARRVRECHVLSEIVPSTMPVAEVLAKRPKGIILSGGPASVCEPGAPPVPDGLFE